MDLRRLLILPLLVAAPLAADSASPLDVPLEMRTFVHHATVIRIGTRAKLQALLDATFRPSSEGGLGLTYDNSRTRTVAEVWTEHKANCLSMTAFYVAACKCIDLDARYAEALNTGHWRRVGDVIRFERHVVALVKVPPMEDVVADFLPQLRRRTGTYLVEVLPQARFLALFYSNRAVELLDGHDLPSAMEVAETALRTDPASGTAWNIQGVVLQAMGKVSEAEAAYRRALKLEPKNGATIGNLEALMRATDRPQEAASFRAMGLDLRKKDPYFQSFMAEEALAAGDLEEAQRRAEGALRIQPYEPEFHLLMARVWIQRGHLDEAMKSLERAKRWATPAERERYDSKLTNLKKK